MSRRLVLDDGRNQRELVVRERMTVGRDPGCDISDGDPRLSRRHAEFLASAGGLVVREISDIVLATGEAFDDESHGLSSGRLLRHSYPEEAPR